VSWLLGGLIRSHQRRHPGKPVDLKVLPLQLRLWVHCLSSYDVGFSRAFWDGSACDFSHAEALARIQCPMLLLHANWFVHRKLGLIGAMEEHEAMRACSLVKASRYLRVRDGHVIHMERPEVFVRELIRFADELSTFTPAPRRAA
jgi:pimeloyl-ACP methyl ester carboxylesterase